MTRSNPQPKDPYRHINRVTTPGRHLISGYHSLRSRLHGFIKDSGFSTDALHEYFETTEEGWRCEDDNVIIAHWYVRGITVELLAIRSQDAPLNGELLPNGKLQAKFPDGRTVSGPVDISVWQAIVAALPSEAPASEQSVPPPDHPVITNRQHTDAGYRIGGHSSAFAHIGKSALL